MSDYLQTLSMYWPLLAGIAVFFSIGFSFRRLVTPGKALRKKGVWRELYEHQLSIRVAIGAVYGAIPGLAAIPGVEGLANKMMFYGLLAFVSVFLVPIVRELTGFEMNAPGNSLSPEE